MLAPPDFLRRVDVLDEYVKDRLADGFVLDKTPDLRAEYHNSTPNRHKGKAAFILACGPSVSLVPEPLIRKLVQVTRAVTWVTNHAFQLLNGRPYNGAEYYMVVDEPFWVTHREAIGAYLRDNPFTLPVLAFDPWESLRFQKIAVNVHEEPEHASYRVNEYFYGRSVGVYASLMALHCGCTKLYLLGHDLVPHNGKSHSHGVRRPEEAVNYPQGRGMFAGYERLAKIAESLGVAVVNLSPISALECFQRADIESVLAEHEKPS